MEITREKILDLLYESIRELNEQLGKEQQLMQSPQTTLLTDGAGLDSLGFVNLVALIEGKCQERFGRNIVLSNSVVKPGERDPFKAVGILAEYIELILTDRLSLWR